MFRVFLFRVFLFRVLLFRCTMRSPMAVLDIPLPTDLQNSLSGIRYKMYGHSCCKFPILMQIPGVLPCSYFL